jgi:uncharacterized protein with HEPN domain
MTKRDDKITLDEIAANIRFAREFVAGHDLDSFTLDSKTLYAVVRALEIISEATRRLSPELKARNPIIPWRRVEDAGNQYRHVYHRLEVEQLWDTVHSPLDEPSMPSWPRRRRPGNDFDGTSM